MKIAITKEELGIVEAQFREAQTAKPLMVPDPSAPDGMRIKPPDVQLSLQKTLADLGEKYGYEPRSANINVNETTFEAMPDLRMIGQLLGTVSRMLDLWTEGKALEYTEILVHFGFIHRAKYDPAVHGTMDGAPPPGDDIFAMSPRGMTVLNATRRRLNG